MASFQVAGEVVSLWDMEAAGMMESEANEAVIKSGVILRMLCEEKERALI